MYVRARLLQATPDAESTVDGTREHSRRTMMVVCESGTGCAGALARAGCFTVCVCSADGMRGHAVM
eukprot:5237354-Prymnesium_polylepis.2